MRSRYSRTAAATTRRQRLAVKPFVSATIWRLAHRRLTSHSQGPRSVSSKSLMSKTTLRSGVANLPKFVTCASPHAWTVRPVVGVSARSAAMIAAPPRKNANGDSGMRARRIGTSSGTREASCSLSSATGSRWRSGHTASARSDRGTTLRRSRPNALRSPHASPAIGGSNCGAGYEMVREEMPPSSTDTRMPSGSAPQYDSPVPMLPKNNISSQVAGKVATRNTTMDASSALITGCPPLTPAHDWDHIFAPAHPDPGDARSRSVRDAEAPAHDLAGQLERVRVLAEDEVHVGGQDDPVELERELVRVLVG